MGVGHRLAVKKNDLVMVIAGKDRGKQGRVLKVIPKRERIVVERVNLLKRHTRPSQMSRGGIVEKEAPLHVSNVMVICNRCNRPVRTGKAILADGKKVRVCKKCREVID